MSNAKSARLPPDPAPGVDPDPRRAASAARINDFALKIATPNGTGSASANALLMQAIFRMGIPVSGKNLFPSNIQGLPTWYEIRVNPQGHTARTPRFDLMVAMNPASYARDVAEVVTGGWLIHDSTWPLRDELRRADLTLLGIPLAGMCNDRFEGARERILMKNIAYVGALTALLDLDADIVRQLLEETYGRKQALLESNFLAIELGYDYAREHFDCPLPIRLAPLAATRDHILIDGNTAAALGCLYAGATVAAWYPITPSTSLVEAFGRFCDRYRKDPESGKRRVAIVQAEDELAAAGVVIGAAWNGARAFTATSGPGISLMGEFIGLAYYAEIPSVFFDIQRVGPSTGMPTRTQQGDLLAIVYASHGDTKHIALFPADPRECFDFAVAAFDIAERFQTPVFVLSDLDIGMNDWVVPRLEWDDAYRPDRGKVLHADELARIDTFYRYLDSDGDGIPYRTLPGEHPKGAYFTRGSGHDRFGRYTEDADGYADVLARIARKIDGTAVHLPPPELCAAASLAHTGNGRRRGRRRTVASGAELGVIGIGSTRGAMLEAQARLADQGLAVDCMRIRSFPFHSTVAEFIAAHEVSFVVDQNRDGQLLTLLTAEGLGPRDRLRSIRHFGGMSIPADAVVDGILQELANAQDRVVPVPSPSPSPSPSPKP
ncbi:MAG: 2-oxoacid:acceptor oxidoreductase subunit alpha [Longimicrobiales bacterium]